MEVIKVFTDLFEHHAPETLMALFGAGTSLLLFYLVWTMLRQLFGLQNRSVDWEADQEQAITALMERMVLSLVTEAEQLRNTLNGILEESVRRSEHNAQLLAVLVSLMEETPAKVLALLQPEFQQLHQQIQQTEARGVSQLDVAEQEDQPDLIKQTQAES